MLFRSIVLDCGANVGVFVKKALSRGAARVIAIEPAPENIAVLRKNFAAEIASGKVTIYEKGVWDKDDVLGMHIDPADSARDSFVRQSEGAKELRIPVTTIDHLVAELGLPRVDFIKMDIEGMEKLALQGAEETIKTCKPILYVENDREEKSKELIEFIDSLDYVIYKHLAPLYNPNNYYNDKEDVFINESGMQIVSGNVFCHHKDVQCPIDTKKFAMEKIN